MKKKTLTKHSAAPGLITPHCMTTEFKLKRRRRYRMDPAYRARCKRQARLFARASRMDPQNVDRYQNLMRQRLHNMQTGISKWNHKWKSPTTGRTIRGMTLPQFAEFIDRHPVTVGHWKKAGLIPPPGCPALRRVGKGPRNVVIYPEALAGKFAALITASLRHNRAHFLPTNQALRSTLWAAHRNQQLNPN